MMIFIYLIISLLTVFWLYLQRHFGYWERRQIKHSKPKIPAGNMQEWMRSKHFAEIFAEAYEKFKGTGLFAGFYFNMQKALIVLDLDLAKSILVKNFNSFERRGLFHNEKDDPLTGNLFSLDGPKWRFLRAKLSPTFTSGKMKYMFPTVVKVGSELQQVMGEKIYENNFIEITDLLGRFTSDAIGSCAFGLDCCSLRDPNAEFCRMGRKFFTERRHHVIVDGLINSFPELAKLLRLKTIPQDVSDFYINIVRETVKYREQNGIKRFDFMDLLIQLKHELEGEGKENLTLEELTAQAFVFFVAGFDTSSTTLSYVLYELAQNMTIQDKLRQEIIHVLLEYEQELSYDCLQAMKYLKQVVSETLRKYPVAPALFRKCTERYSPANSHYYIEKDCMIIIPSMSFHHDPEYFPEPEKFVPERFSPSNIGSIKACSYLPFGEGPRNCIGMRFGLMQTSIGLVQLLRRFKFETCAETKIPIDFVKPSFNLNPQGGVTLKVTEI